MRFLVVVANRMDYQARKTFHEVEANSAADAQQKALEECKRPGPWGLPFKVSEKVHVDRCIQSHGNV